MAYLSCYLSYITNLKQVKLDYNGYRNCVFIVFSLVKGVYKSVILELWRRAIISQGSRSCQNSSWIL